MSKNVFEKRVDLTVSFESLEQDLVQRARERLLNQFKSNYPLPSQFKKYRQNRIDAYLSDGYDRTQACSLANKDVNAQRDILIDKVQSPVLAQIMNAIGEEFDELYQAGLQVLKQRTLKTAEGVNLDVIGNIVGTSRTLFDASLLPWLESDSANGMNPDVSNAWIQGVKTTGDKIMQDEEYRNAILAKIFKNHCSFASHPEVRLFGQILLGKNLSFRKTGMLEMSLVIPVGMSITTMSYLTTQLKSANIENNYVLPLPPTVNIRDDVFDIVAIDNEGNGCSLAVDQMAGRPDHAKSTLTIKIERGSNG